MNLSNFYVWLYMLEGINAIINVLLTIAILAVLTAIVTWGISKYNAYFYKDMINFKKEYNGSVHLNNLLSKILKILAPICFVLCVLTIFSPTKKDVLTYASLKQVDVYNEQVVDSNLTPQNVIESVDNVADIIMKVQDIVENHLDALEAE